MTTKAQQTEAQEKVAILREIVKPGQKVYTILRHVSSSGMSRDISLIVITKDCQLRDISWLAAKAMGRQLSKKEGIKIGGCGMDMGFALVYDLADVLYGGGYTLDHSWL